MGKGQRARAARAAEKEANREILVQQAKKQKIKKLTTWIVTIVVLVSIIGGVTINSIRTRSRNSGTAMRNAIVMETDNYSVSAAMMSFYFYQQYNSFVNNSSENSYLSGILDTSVSLKSQECMLLEDGGTWFDYFSNQAGETVKNYVYLAEKAIAEGMELTEEDKKGIDASLDGYESVAEGYNMSLEDFLPAAFGLGVNVDDIRACMELEMMANKYQSQYIKGLSYTDKEVDEFYKENMNDYRYVDYYSYSVTASDSKDKNTYAAAEKAAKELAKVENTKEFSAWVEVYERKNAKITDDYTKEDFEKELKDKLANLEIKGAVYSEGDDASKWLFEKAKVGDTYISDNESGIYTVYYSTATPYRDNEITRTIRQIILHSETHGTKEDAKKMASTVMKELGEQGWSAAAFDDYAANYSEDGNTYMLGGLCENYSKNNFEAKIGEWAFGADRKKGEAKLIELDDGYAVCYYVGEGVEGWKAACIDTMKNEEYAADYETWTKEIKMTINEENYSEIPDIV